MMTLSPPCPSWSKGGKHSGLATDEGFCFLDAVEHMSRVRPIIALFECSDGIEAHPHWRVLSAALQLAGYKQAWSQDVAIHQLTGNYRTRWLAVWIRKDISASKTSERFLCMINKRLHWNHQKHMHELPRTLVEDLALRTTQESIYGDRALLPSAKRTKIDIEATVKSVLEQRLLLQGDYLPTLCASYSAQHLLQREHLEAKGILPHWCGRMIDSPSLTPLLLCPFLGLLTQLGYHRTSEPPSIRLAMLSHKSMP